MRTRRIHFEQITVKAIRRWKDKHGLRKQETRSFTQTLNPFNLNARGVPKSRQEILAELYVQSAAWHQEAKP
jgi:hypothetical protein